MIVSIRYSIGRGNGTGGDDDVVGLAIKQQLESVYVILQRGAFTTTKVSKRRR